MSTTVAPAIAGFPDITERQQRHPQLAQMQRLVPDAREGVTWLRRGPLASSPLLPSIIRRWLLRRGGVHIEGYVFGLDRCFIQSANVRIGPGCGFAKGLYIEGNGRVEFGRNSGTGPEVMIVTSNHPVGADGVVSRWPEWHDTTIGEGCWIGARAMLMPGITIGDGAVIAAGAVVTRDVEPGALVAGVPARRVR